MTMIDFACKTFNIENIIKCSLGLTKSEYKILGFFIDNPENYFTSEEISKELSLNLTTIQKAVKKLKERDILIRSQENLNSGGYLFNYKLSSKQNIRNTVKKIIETWSEKVKSSVDSW
jgi:predicted transcriptional regulator